MRYIYIYSYIPTLFPSLPRSLSLSVCMCVYVRLWVHLYVCMNVYMSLSVRGVIYIYMHMQAEGREAGPDQRARWTVRLHRRAPGHPGLSHPLSLPVCVCVCVLE